MTVPDQAANPVTPHRKRSLAVRKAAAEAAVAASRRTGRPVDPRVKKLAESKLGDYDPDNDPDYSSNT